MADPPLTLRTVVADELRLLTFRRPSAAIALHWRAYLAFGLCFVALAGVGRYWDNPRAHLWQSLGLGSVAYVFCLALILWLLLLPLRPKSWSYRNVLVFLCLTAPPALLYAIPVERFLTLPAAQAANAWFLALVAAWRVGLLMLFLRRVAGLSRVAVVVATLLPLVVIVVALTLLNLEHVVFELMSGTRPEDRSANDLSYTVVMVIAFFSIYATPVLLIAYAWLAWRARRARLPDPGEAV